MMRSVFESMCYKSISRFEMSFISKKIARNGDEFVASEQDRFAYQPK